MGSRKVTAEELDSITQLARSWGKIIARWAFGDQGPGLDVDLGQMEAVAAARGLTAGALQAATSQQAQHLAPSSPASLPEGLPIRGVVGLPPSRTAP